MRSTPLPATRKALAVLAAVTAMTAAATGLTASASSATDTRPVLKVPFPCQETWRGATYSSHNPQLAIDFNQGSGDSDKGRPVKASADGTVLSVVRSDAEGYGNRILIGHGGGWRSFYAHLEDGSITVQAGDHVTAATVIGKVGKSGLNPNEPSETAHLHYEQRRYIEGEGEKLVPIRFGTSTWVEYYSTDYYTRTNC
jgi:hypothetical protein